MVEIKMIGMCEGCKYPHLYLNHSEEDTYADGVTHTYTIECKHEPACMRAAAIGRRSNIEVMSNIITDLTLNGATKEELEKAIKHSMDVIDMAKEYENVKKVMPKPVQDDVKTLYNDWE